MRDEIRRIVCTQKARNLEAADRGARRLVEARAEAERLTARFVREDPSTRLILLFGSVASGTPRSDRFDIDLAVDAEDYLRLVTVAEESSFEVDVLDLRNVSEWFRDHILRRGVLLHGTVS